MSRTTRRTLAAVTLLLTALLLPELIELHALGPASQHAARVRRRTPVPDQDHRRHPIRVLRTSYETLRIHR